MLTFAPFPATRGHDHSSQLTDEQFNNQVAWVEEALIKILGVVPNHFRPPYGDFDDANIAVLSARNYSAAVIWDQISGPATGTTVDASNQMYRTVAATFPQNHIVLQHEQDTVAITQIIPAAIRELQSAGYRLVTTSECLGVPAYQWVGEPLERDVSDLTVFDLCKVFSEADGY
jgi:peptidoglycan/xylan/chitin deacetylase (PgdA/CDA1 family)